jgi:hypothetical protein
MLACNLRTSAIAMVSIPFSSYFLISFSFSFFKAIKDGGHNTAGDHHHRPQRR